MDSDALKDDLHTYLREGRDSLLWKLDGLGEYDVRRPLVPTGTNLLGLVKHLAIVEAAYFGAIFDRPFPEPLPWWEDGAEPNSDMWATPDESRADILGFYARATAHADATIAALPHDAVGTVTWWNDGQVTLHRMLVHVATETHRHAGHADIVRELIDGEAGFRREYDNLPELDAEAWTTFRARLESAAREAAGRTGA